MTAAAAQLTAAEAKAPAAPWWRRWVSLAVVGVVVIVTVWFVRREFPAWDELVAAVDRVNLGLLGLAALAEVLSMWLFARQQQWLFSGFGVGAPMRSVLAITYSRSAMSMTFPAGGIVSAAFAVDQFRRIGAERATAVTVTVLSGIASIAGLFVLYGVGGGAVALFGAVGHSGAVVTTVSCVLVAGLAVTWVKRRGGVQSAVRPVLDVAVVSTRWGKIRAAVRRQWVEIRSLSGRYWAGAIGLAAANWATDVVCLSLVGHAFGLHISIVQLGAVYLTIQVIRQIPLSPGGLGIIETSLTAGLLVLGADNATAAAAALGYRLLSCWLIIPIGLGAWWLLSRRQARA
jgi:hypothetical protein